ncbi:hypothetical protein E2C01_073011 [Portunus trituberculatus]|uniref:Uncharacterized protein n=1 Tax=Portunus trituberculatus TaxID=210409 RepID=A0A5B7I888_PORTR|nr:hypothetical protein [Portunus trituberculatus]
MVGGHLRVYLLFLFFILFILLAYNLASSPHLMFPSLHSCLGYPSLMFSAAFIPSPPLHALLHASPHLGCTYLRIPFHPSRVTPLVFRKKNTHNKEDK